jgi:hypothetical protein
VKDNQRLPVNDKSGSRRMGDEQRLLSTVWHRWHHCCGGGNATADFTNAAGLHSRTCLTGRDKSFDDKPLCASTLCRSSARDLRSFAKPTCIRATSHQADLRAGVRTNSRQTKSTESAALTHSPNQPRCSARWRTSARAGRAR